MKAVVQSLVLLVALVFCCGVASAQMATVPARTPRDVDPAVAGEIVAIIEERLGASSPWRALLLDTYPFSSSAITRAMIITHVARQLSTDPVGIPPCQSYARAAWRARQMLAMRRVAPFESGDPTLTANMEARCTALGATAVAGPTADERVAIHLAANFVANSARSTDSARAYGTPPQ